MWTELNESLTLSIVPIRTTDGKS